ncbi:hypothetical protein CEXT_467781 [Caerostris extrusa]|uniref:Uncharacterized protein n=1 Tax=Caerostris extrusa TaxID=172846 RepID=A0AAV4VS17_CAEEX|nr:hypothetical protein CEXT_467781 [Caerostris extrusa]
MAKKDPKRRMGSQPLYKAESRAPFLFSFSLTSEERLLRRAFLIMTCDRRGHALFISAHSFGVSWQSGRLSDGWARTADSSSRKQLQPHPSLRQPSSKREGWWFMLFHQPASCPRNLEEGYSNASRSLFAIRNRFSVT